MMVNETCSQHKQVPCVTGSMRGEQEMGETVIYSGIQPGKVKSTRMGLGKTDFQQDS